MHNHKFRKIDAARLCEQQLGLAAGTIVSVDADNDGMVDGDLVIFHTSDLSELAGDGPDEDYVYFGDFIVESYDAATAECSFKINGVRSFEIQAGYTCVGSEIDCVIWDEVSTLTNVSLHFYGWRFSK